MWHDAPGVPECPIFPARPQRQVPPQHWEDGGGSPPLRPLLSEGSLQASPCPHQSGPAKPLQERLPGLGERLQEIWREGEGHRPLEDQGAGQQQLPLYPEEHQHHHQNIFIYVTLFIYMLYICIFYVKWQMRPPMIVDKFHMKQDVWSKVIQA